MSLSGPILTATLLRLQHHIQILRAPHPLFAARRYHRTASASSWGTPRPVSVHPTQVVLRVRMPLFRSETVPPDCLLRQVPVGHPSVVLRTSNPGCLRVRIPLFRSETVPPDCLCVVLGDTSSVCVHPPRLYCAPHPPVPQRDGTTGLLLRRPGEHLVRCRTSNPGWSARPHPPVPRGVSIHAVRSHSRPCCMRPSPFGNRRQLLYPRLHWSRSRVRRGGRRSTIRRDYSSEQG